MNINLIKKEQVTGFDKGMKVMEDRMKAFREDLRNALDVRSTVQVSQYRHGKTKMNYPRIMAVNAVFEKYGIYEPFDIEEQGW